MFGRKTSKSIFSPKVFEIKKGEKISLFAIKNILLI